MDFATDAGECAELPAHDNEQGSHKLSLERPLGSNKEGIALGEALYWMAEKLTWGYEDVEPDTAEALKLFRQSADLGFSDALIRIGQLQQQGKGTVRDPSAALKNYTAASKAGNFVALAFLANLLSRSSHLERANALWDRFFAKLKANPGYAFIVAERGELLHDYITTQLQLGFEPEHLEVLRQHRVEIAGHHQRLLEHAPFHKLDRLGGAMKWIEINLGPWPI
jgi:Sel1 repeat